MKARKTDRKYGSKWELIRSFAALSDRPFDPHVFTPALTYHQAVTACRQLAKRGEILLLRPGHCANYKSRPPLFGRAPIKPCHPSNSPR